MNALWSSDPFYSFHDYTLALCLNEVQSAMAIASVLEDCTDVVARGNYLAILESLVNEHVRRKIINSFAKSKRFKKWMTENQKKAFRALHDSKSLNIMLDIFNEFGLSFLKHEGSNSKWINI